jgi:glutaryl-CoA dehydrogenase
VFDNVKVPKENLLPNGSGPCAVRFGCLDSARYGIAWGASAPPSTATSQRCKLCSMERIQFDKPIAAFQLTQKKAGRDAHRDHQSAAAGLAAGVLKNEGNRATTQQISMAKRNNVDMALHIAREARQIHGGMGITGEYPIMRHMMNLESVITYEGTHDIHLLIT